MYVPRHFREDRLECLTAFIRDHPFATLVSPGADGLLASHVPLLWDPEPAPYGTLTGHVARANPHARGGGAGDSLAIFLGPQAYVSPSWYPSKRRDGRVVPTWNYVAVHAEGPLRTVDDPAWLRAFVTRLTDARERTLPAPWRVTDAPEAFVERMLGAIVGLELTVRRLQGKWKLGQNRPAEDRDGAIAGLRARGDADSAAVADAMAAAGRDRPD